MIAVAQLALLYMAPGTTTARPLADGVEPVRDDVGDVGPHEGREPGLWSLGCC